MDDKASPCEIPGKRDREKRTKFTNCLCAYLLSSEVPRVVPAARRLPQHVTHVPVTHGHARSYPAEIRSEGGRCQDTLVSAMVDFPDAACTGEQQQELVEEAGVAGSGGVGSIGWKNSYLHPSKLY